MKLLTKLFKDESGATAIEYGLIAALISVAIILMVTALGTELNETFSTVKGALDTANSGAGGGGGGGGGR